MVLSCSIISIFVFPVVIRHIQCFKCDSQSKSVPPDASDRIPFLSCVLKVTQDLRAEQGSVLKMGSKKTNLNHLLNFSIGHSDVSQYDSRFDISCCYWFSNCTHFKRVINLLNKVATEF